VSRNPPVIEQIADGKRIHGVGRKQRPVHVFKIEIGTWTNAKAALNIVKEYLASRSISIIAKIWNGVRRLR
jgi:hypothetical protein